jgi:hypothetical protein
MIAVSLGGKVGAIGSALAGESAASPLAGGAKPGVDDGGPALGAEGRGVLLAVPLLAATGAELELIDPGLAALALPAISPSPLVAGSSGLDAGPAALGALSPSVFEQATTLSSANKQSHSRIFFMVIS